MNILLDKWRKVEDVQAEFNGAYPYLKLCFVNKGQSQNALAKAAVGASLTFGDLNANIIPYKMEVSDQMAVNELEKIMSAYINIPVKILRKSGNVWLETSITGNWSLAQQNEHAREISSLSVI